MRFKSLLNLFIVSSKCYLGVSGDLTTQLNFIAWFTFLSNHRSKTIANFILLFIVILCFSFSLIILFLRISKTTKNINQLQFLMYLFSNILLSKCFFIDDPFGIICKFYCEFIIIQSCIQTKTICRFLHRSHSTLWHFNCFHQIS